MMLIAGFTPQSSDERRYFGRWPHKSKPLVKVARMQAHLGAIAITRDVNNVFTFFLPCCIVCNAGLAIVNPSVPLFVCPSVKRVNCDKTNETSAQILIGVGLPYERSMHLDFKHEEWLVGGRMDDPFYQKCWAKLNHSLQKCRLPLRRNT